MPLQLIYDRSHTTLQLISGSGIHVTDTFININQIDNPFLEIFSPTSLYEIKRQIYSLRTRLGRAKLLSQALCLLPPSSICIHSHSFPLTLLHQMTMRIWTYIPNNVFQDILADATLCHHVRVMRVRGGGGECF